MTEIPATEFDFATVPGWAELVNRVFREKQKVLARMMARARGDLIEDAEHLRDRCGPEITMPPARGRLVAFEPMELRASARVAMPGGFEDYELEHVGYRGRDAARQADAFDVMEDQARRAHRGAAAAFVAPFTPGQVAIARHYRALVERHDAGGMKCASLETVRRGDGRGGSFMDAFLAEGYDIDRLRARIGDGIAMPVRRQRAGSARRAIPDRVLVDMVCLQDMTLSAVLARHGWPDRGENIIAARLALATALERMRGHLEKGA
ncbi:hypothetical protein [Halodurantibacterium flavum]|uniref:Uncharacterized protein n=1 Tax=Halodurantibacterium flavum TaxID=1382802 RepID=A0ABW4S8M9_9RHOB